MVEKTSRLPQVKRSVIIENKRLSTSLLTTCETTLDLDLKKLGYIRKISNSHIVIA